MDRHIARYLLIGGQLLLLPAVPALATDVGPGPVSGTWTQAGSPYVVLGHITVPGGETLEIQPGVEVRFDGPYVLDVEGVLLAEGSWSDTVVFTTTPGRQAWGHIEIGPDADGASTLSYCRIEHSNSTVHDSLYSNHGGGIYMKGGYGTRIEHSTVADCVGAFGGGIYADGDVSVADCIVRTCEAVDVSPFQGRGGGIAALGGAMVTDCTVVDNSAAFEGGGIAAYGSSTYYFVGVIDGCIVRGNHSDWHGGGMTLDHPSSGSQVTGNLIYQNTATHDGGGIHLWYGSVGTFEYNTIARNEADRGAGMAYGYTAPLSVDRTIIGFNAGEATKVTSGSSLVVFNRTCAFGNEGGNALEGTTMMCIEEDPLFCDMFGEDYALCGNSPCRSDGPSGLIGALDVGCGECESVVRPISWGALKARYRP